MSKAKELKTNPENNINMYELLSLFSPEKKSKYVDTLFRLMKKSKNFKEHVKEVKEHLLKTFDFLDEEEINQLPDLTAVYFYRFLDSYFNQSDLVSFRKFCEYNERGLIKQNDVSKYSSFEELHNSLSLAEMIVQTKEMEKQIKIVAEDENWLILRPLTFEASKKYGSNTKWCTTTENNPEYFNKYSKRGVLIYIINKSTGYKVASFYSLDKNDPEFSWWDQKDSRIDSLDADVTDDVRKIIRDESKAEGTKSNNALLSTKERKSENTKGIKQGTLGFSSEIDEAAEVSRRTRRAIERVQEEETETYAVERAEEESYENRDIREIEAPRSQSLFDGPLTSETE